LTNEEKYIIIHRDIKLEVIMDNSAFLNKLKWWFFDPLPLDQLPLAGLERQIEICPDDLWNKKISGYYFWQYMLHAFISVHWWLREEETEFTEPYKDEKILYSQMEKDPQRKVSKDEMRKFIVETKEFAEKWFNGKDDSWLQQTNKLWGKFQNWEVIVSQVHHLAYHVGFNDAILRENGINGIWNE
jgi:hypothetical protein